MKPATVLLLVALVLSAGTAGCIRSFDDDNVLTIEGIDVSAPSVASGHVVLAVNATLDNLHGDSGPVRLMVKAFDTSTGLLTVTNETAVGEVPEDKTRVVETRLRVPRTHGYRVAVSAYEDDQVVDWRAVEVRNVGALQPNLFETGLAIGTMDFMVRNVSGDRVRIQASVYVTNEARTGADAVRMQVKAREVSTGLISDEVWTRVGGVGLEETHVFPVNLTVPSRYNYAVEAVLWDGAHVVERGEGRVQLLPTFTKGEDEELVVTEPDLRDFERREGADRRNREYAGSSPDSVPGPGAALVLAAAAAAAVLAAARRRRRREG